MNCAVKDCNELASCAIHYGAAGAVAMCFGCADRFMRALAPENVAGGSTVGDTAAGYRRWRDHVGKPCSVEEALAVASGKTP